MKRLLNIMYLATLGLPMLAQAADPLIGQFSHDFTEPAHQPVWSIAHKGESIVIHTFGDDGDTLAEPMSMDEQKQFWQYMMWDESGLTKATCIQSDDIKMCHAPFHPEAQYRYFYFDHPMGLMSIHKISDQP